MRAENHITEIPGKDGKKIHYVNGKYVTEILQNIAVFPANELPVLFPSFHGIFF